MIYPLHLLPQIEYKSINCDLSEYYLTRHFDILDDSTPLVDANGLLEDKYLFSPSSRLGDMSTSLLSVFERYDINVALTRPAGVKSFAVYCNNDFTSTIPKIFEHFYFANNRSSWQIKIGTIHGIELNSLNADGSNEKAFYCEIIHTPAKWNFWHFSIRWKFADGNYFFQLFEENKVNKGNIKRISSAVRILLKKHAELDVVDCPVLPPHHYMK